jgi:hypothetical protein
MDILWAARMTLNYLGRHPSKCDDVRQWDGAVQCDISSDEPYSNWLWYARHVQVVGREHTG